MKPFLSKRYNYMYGVKLILSPWLFVTLLIVLGPIQYQNVSWAAILFLSFFLLTFFVSYTFGFQINKVEKSTIMRPCQLNQLYVFFGVMACAFILLSSIDFFLVKGASLTEIVESRDKGIIDGVRNSWLGFFIFFTASSIPIFLIIIFLSHKSMGLNQKILSYFILLLGFMALLLPGGRLSIFITLLLAFFFWRTHLKRNCHFSKKNLLIIVGVISYSLYLGVLRAEKHYSDVATAMFFMQESNNIIVSPVVFDTPFFNSLYYGYIMLVFYFSHAIFVIGEYFNESYNKYLMGGYTFTIFGRIVDYIFHTDFFNNSQSNLLKKGFYHTAPGSLYLDFGYASILFAVFLGFLFGYYMRNIQSLTFTQRLNISFLCVTLVMSPFMPSTAAGNGGAIFLSIILLNLVSFAGFKPGNFCIK